MRIFVDVSLFFKQSLHTHYARLSFVQCSDGYIMPLEGFYIMSLDGYIMPLEGLFDSINVDQCIDFPYLRLLSFFTFENKHWFEILFSHTMRGIAPLSL